MRRRCGKKLIGAYSPAPDEIDAALDLYGIYRSERDASQASGQQRQSFRAGRRGWWMDQPGTAKDGYVPQYYEPTGPTKEQAELVGDIYRRVSHSCHYNESLDLMQTASRNPETPSKKGNRGGAAYIGFAWSAPRFSSDGSSSSKQVSAIRREVTPIGL